MKIYFAGPLFTPYVRKFISEHGAVLRANGIDPFVPHEKFNSLITRERVEELIADGTITRQEVGEGDFRERVMELVRRGRVSRDQLGLPQMTPEIIFDTDYEGLAAANAVVAILDGTQVDDGTACEIGIFCAMMRKDPAKKGIVGWMTDSRGITRAGHGFGGYGLNLFVLGVLDECGVICDNFEDVLKQLKAWE